jgi:hypothetical protein
VATLTGVGNKKGMLDSTFKMGTENENFALQVS